jgi:hypothetical protein
MRGMLIDQNNPVLGLRENICLVQLRARGPERCTQFLCRLRGLGRLGGHPSGIGCTGLGKPRSHRCLRVERSLNGRRRWMCRI